MAGDRGGGKGWCDEVMRKKEEKRKKRKKRERNA